MTRQKEEKKEMEKEEKEEKKEKEEEKFLLTDRRTGGPIQMIICKRLVPPDDHLQEAGPSR